MGESYADRWKRKERELGWEDTEIEMVGSGEWVLPSEAAPCLTFQEAVRPQPIWDVCGIPSHWSAEERGRLASYRVIGSDGSGNPICVEAASGAVWLLDHEDGWSVQFVNTGVPQLAECLLAFCGERSPERFRSAVRSIDPPALAEQSFWWQAAVDLATTS
jgi:hypothetical protein